jgi:hypothetical protein
MRQESRSTAAPPVKLQVDRYQVFHLLDQFIRVILRLGYKTFLLPSD